MLSGPSAVSTGKGSAAAIAFHRLPELGHSFTIDGQRYELFKIEPYIRKGDGKPTHLLHWSAKCATCQGLFTAVTGLVAKGPNRRCQDCAAAHRPVKTGSWQAVTVEHFEP